MKYIDLEKTKAYRHDECPHLLSCKTHKYIGTLPSQQQVSMMRCKTHKIVYVLDTKKDTGLLDRFYCFK